MARKTAIHTTNAEQRSAEHKSQERRDRLAATLDRRTLTGAPRPKLRTAPNLLPVAVSRYSGSGIDTSADSLWKRANDAARLELRGSSYSSEDRRDVAARIVALLIARGEHVSLDTSPRVSLTRLCGMARNYRDGIDRQRATEHEAHEQDRARRAASPSALGIGRDASTPADHVRIVAESSLAGARAAAERVCTDLGLLATAPRSGGPSGAYAVLYQWARQTTDDTLTSADVAAEHDMARGAWSMLTARGAKLLRESIGAHDLADRLTLGAGQTITIGTDAPDTYQCAGTRETHTYADLYGAVLAVEADTLTMVVRDDSREATHTSAARKLAAGKWRERPSEDAPVSVRKMSATERVHWSKRTERRANRAAELADALRNLGRAIGQTEQGRRERGVSATGELARSIGINRQTASAPRRSRALSAHTPRPSKTARALRSAPRPRAV